MKEYTLTENELRSLLRNTASVVSIKINKKIRFDDGVEFWSPDIEDKIITDFFTAIDVLRKENE